MNYINQFMHYSRSVEVVAHIYTLETSLSRHLLSPLHHPPPQFIPHSLLLGHGHASRQPARSRSHKNRRPIPPLAAPHILALILPPIPELLLPDRPPLTHPPHGLPDTLPDQTDGARPLRRDLGLQHGHTGVHLRAAEHARVARRALHDVRIADVVQLRQPVRVRRRVALRRDPRRVQELPEQVGRVRVRVPRCARHDARIHADEQQREVWGDGVAEEGSGGRWGCGGARGGLRCWRSG